MLEPRIIPCLLLDGAGLVKTVRFSSPKYVGDPINAVKIFNEKEVDELLFLDIGATRDNKEPSYDLIERVASQCRMPLCYGGGIKTVEQAKRVLGLGVEKISLSSSAISNPELIKSLMKQVGVQSVVVTLDVKKTPLKRYAIYCNNGKRKSKLKLEEYLSLLYEMGVGEVVINNIDRDGVMLGYDHDLVELVKRNVKVPLTILGGAGSLEDLSELIDKFGLVGTAAGSLFVFKGKYKAVLINYPDLNKKSGMLDFYSKKMLQVYGRYN